MNLTQKQMAVFVLVIYDLIKGYKRHKQYVCPTWPIDLSVYLKGLTILNGILRNFI